MSFEIHFQCAILSKEAEDVHPAKCEMLVKNDGLHLLAGRNKVEGKQTNKIDVFNHEMHYYWAKGHA